MPESMSLEERVLFMEFMLDAIIWGPHLEDSEHRQKIASHLYTFIEASQRHQAHPPIVQNALLRFADALAEIDNVPSALKPSLRPLIAPADPTD